MKQKMSQLTFRKYGSEKMSGLSKLRTLVVDDEETSFMILGSILSSLGFSADSATNKKSMQDQLQKNRYDLIFLTTN
ncbi:MAG: response regulator [Bdellovibrionota bacterium]